MTDPQRGKQLSGRAGRDPAQFSSWQRVIESLIRVAGHHYDHGTYFEQGKANSYWVRERDGFLPFIERPQFRLTTKLTCRYEAQRNSGRVKSFVRSCRYVPQLLLLFLERVLLQDTG